MHDPILPHDPLPREPDQQRKHPLPHRMAPIRGTGVGPTLSAARAAQPAQHGLDKAAGARHEEARAADLAHGGGDEVGLDELDGDVEGGELGAEGGGPLLQERFAATVGGQERSGEETSEGAHVENQAALAGDHAGDNEVGDAQGGEAVDGDDPVHFRRVGLGEGDGDGMRGADVVD